MTYVNIEVGELFKAEDDDNRMNESRIALIITLEEQQPKVFPLTAFRANDLGQQLCELAERMEKEPKVIKACDP